MTQALLLLAAGGVAVYALRDTVLLQNVFRTCVKPLTDEEILARITPPLTRANLTGRAGFDQRAFDQTMLAAQMGLIPPIEKWGQKCPDPSKNPEISKIEKGTQLGSLGAGAAIAALKLTGLIAAKTAALASTVVGLIATPVLVFFGLRSAHKAKAIAETNLVCAMVPHINNGILAIENARGHREITNKDAIAAYGALAQEADDTLQPVMKRVGEACNLACGLSRFIQAATMRRIDNINSCMEGG